MARSPSPDWSRLLTLKPLSWLPPTPDGWERHLAQQRAALAAVKPRIPEPPELIGNRITASLRDRWFVLGMSGSGKTTFTKRLIKTYRTLYPGARTYVLDSKIAEEDGFAKWPGLVASDTPPPHLRTPGAVQVWQPGTDDVDAIGAWLQGIFNARQPAVVYLDELSSLSEREGGAYYPIALKRMLKQGRSLGLAIIALTQEAAYLPRQIKSQASHLVYFGLQADPHGQRLAADLLGFEAPREPSREYGFFYRHLGRKPGPAWEYPSYREFF